MWFVNDLKQWEIVEHKVALILSEYFWQNVTKHKDKKWVDLIIDDWWMMIEVKYDRMVEDTWNYVFEFKCNWKDSWINRTYDTDKFWKIHPHFLVQAHSKGFELYHTYQVLKYVEEHKDRIVKWGDGWRSEMYLIQKQKVEHLIIKDFNYEDMR